MFGKLTGKIYTGYGAPVGDKLSTLDIVSDEVKISKRNWEIPTES